jgi:hypothetical protein
MLTTIACSDVVAGSPGLKRQSGGKAERTAAAAMAESDDPVSAVVGPALVDRLQAASREIATGVAIRTSRTRALGVGTRVPRGRPRVRVKRGVLATR